MTICIDRSISALLAVHSTCKALSFTFSFCWQIGWKLDWWASKASSQWPCAFKRSAQSSAAVHFLFASYWDLQRGKKGHCWPDCQYNCRRASNWRSRQSMTTAHLATTNSCSQSANCHYCLFAKVSLTVKKEGAHYSLPFINNLLSLNMHWKQKWLLSEPPRHNNSWSEDTFVSKWSVTQSITSDRLPLEHKKGCGLQMLAIREVSHVWRHHWK